MNLRDLFEFDPQGSPAKKPAAMNTGLPGRDSRLRTTARSNRIMDTLRSKYPQAQTDIEALLYYFNVTQMQDRKDIRNLYRDHEKENDFHDRISTAIADRKRKTDQIDAEIADLNNTINNILQSINVQKSVATAAPRRPSPEPAVPKTPKKLPQARPPDSNPVGTQTDGFASAAPATVRESKKKDACYNKVKSRYKVWPSAYASGALVQCRKKGAKNWGNKSQVNEGWRETLAGLAAAGVMAFSGGAMAAGPVTDNPNKITATITIDGDTKIMDLSNKNFRDVREASRWLENFLDQRGIDNWSASIERGQRGSGSYQRANISNSGANLGAAGR